MKKILSLSVALLVLVFMSGCGKSNAMLHSHINKRKQRNEKKYGSTHSGSPDFIFLSQQAPSQRSRYILELVSKFDKTPNSIPTKTIDPLKDKEAKLKIDTQWVKQKRKMITQAKRDGNYNANYVRFLKTVQKDLYKPYKIITTTPSYIQEARIPSVHTTQISNKITMNIQTLTLSFALPQDKSSLELQKEIIQEFDKILPKNGWGRTENFAETTYEETVKDYKNLIAIYQQRLKELSPSDTQQINSINKKIKELQNLLKNTQKRLKDANSEDVYKKSIVIYMYNYRGEVASSYMHDNISMVINADATSVYMTISKTIYKNR